MLEQERTITSVPARTALGLLAAAVVCGAAAKAADESRISALSDLGTFPAVWVLALALLARFSLSPGAAALRAGGFFTAMCAAYYAWSFLVLGFGGARYLALWTAVALLVVPPLAAVLQVVLDRRGPLAGAVVALVAALPVSSGSLWQMWWAHVQHDAPAGFPLHPVQAAVDALVGGVVLALLPRRAATRWWALGLLVPAVVAVDTTVRPLIEQYLAL